jgi:hypothetical protein
MKPREQLIQEIDQSSDALIEEVLDFLLFVKRRQAQRSHPTSTDQEQRSPATTLERMDGIPQHLLSVGNLSDRDVRRNIIATRIQKRQQ